MVVFGDDKNAKIEIIEENVNLAVWADSIYLASQNISINEFKNKKDTNFSYDNGNSTSNSFVNFFIKTDVKGPKNFATQGFYRAKGTFAQQLNNPDSIYTAPTFPNPPGSGGSSSIVITQGC